MDKRILIVHKGQFDNFPPLISVKNAFNDLGYKVDVLTSKLNDISFFKNGEKCYIIKKSTNILLISNIIWYAKYLFKLQQLITLKYNYVWFEGGDTMALFGWFIKPDSRFVFQISELYDKIPLYRFLIGKSINKFKKIVVPEINRGYIFKVWFNLENTPFILPNKPNYSITNESGLLDKTIFEQLHNIELFVGNRKMILYQGVIAKDRKFNGVVKFVKNNPDFCLVLIGRDTGYLKNINIDPQNIYYGGYFMPPLHLEVTKMAYICLMAYDTTSLNKIYCAPNKIWEYAKLSKPIISQRLPGIESIMDKYYFGICCDVDDEKDVSKTIDTINSHYSQMTLNAKYFYDSVNYNQEIKNILGLE